MQSGRQERKHTDITSMIKRAARFSLNLDCAIRENCVGGRLLTDV